MQCKNDTPAPYQPPKPVRPLLQAEALITVGRSMANMGGAQMRIEKLSCRRLRTNGRKTGLLNSFNVQTWRRQTVSKCYHRHGSVHGELVLNQQLQSEPNRVARGRFAAGETPSEFHLTRSVTRTAIPFLCLSKG